MHTRLPNAVVVLLVVGIISACSTEPGKPDKPKPKKTQPAPTKAKQTKSADQEKAIAAIKKLGGKVTLDEKQFRKPVVRVNLSGTKVTDAGLVHLKGLTNLRWLDLGDTNVTDAGLVHLKGLTKLERLDLWSTKVSATGFKELQKALPNCQIRVSAAVRYDLPPGEKLKAVIDIEKLGGSVRLDEKRPGKPVVRVDLNDTEVTDAGLVHLKELANLEQLFLGGRNITDAGLVVCPPRVY